MTRVNNRYTSDFKLKIVKKYLEGGVSIQEIAEEYNIPSKTQVHNWIKKYEKDGEKAFECETRGNPKTKIEAEKSFVFENLEDEINFLRLENEYLKKFCNLLKKRLKNGN